MAKKRGKPTHKLQQNPSRAKRPKKKGGKRHVQPEKIWVENCIETKQHSTPKACGMVVFLSRVELLDGHTHTNNEKVVVPIGSSSSDSTTATKETEDQTAHNKELSLITSEQKVVTPLLSTDTNDDMENNNTSPAAVIQTEEVAIDEKIIDKSSNTNTECIVEKKPTDTTNKDDDNKEEDKDDKLNNDETTTKAEENESNTDGVEDTTTRSQKSDDHSHAYIIVLRAPSAKGKIKTMLKKQKQSKNKFTNLPNGDNGDGILNPYSKDKVADKYWAQRKRLFVKYDQGIQLDKEGWFSVTPEAIANHIAARVAHSVSKNNTSQQNTIVLDAFCGCGGNAIALALRSEISTVVCVDLDIKKLRMAAHNASIYQVDPKRILFIQADATHIMGKYSGGKRLLPDDGISMSSKDIDVVAEEQCKGYVIGGPNLLPSTLDAIFLSPPWGGMNYLNEGKMAYDISKCIKISKTADSQLQAANYSKKTGAPNADNFIDGEELLVIAAKAAKQKNVLYFLPRNINGVSLGRSALKAGYRGKYELEQNVLNGKLKTITAYFHDHLDKPK